MPYKHGNKAINMSTWIQWINNRIKNFGMLRSVWFANMDIMVCNIKYVCDDSYEYKQPSESYKSDKSNEPEQRHLKKHIKYYDDIGYRASSATTLNGSISKLEHDLINIKLNDSINEYSDLYAKLK